MRNIPIYTLLLFILSTQFAGAQCLEWVFPTDSTSWDDLGVVPCTGDSLELNSFEIWQSESYTLEGVEAGGVYTFSHCNGPNAGSWTPEYTVITPAGAIEVFGSGNENNCSVTWIASESGTYQVVINEVDSCGVGATTGNGYPQIKTVSGGEDCPPPPVFIDGAVSFENGSLPECWTVYDEDGDNFSWNFSTLVDGFEGIWAIRSQSYLNDFSLPLTPDNYLVSPPLEIGENDSLYYVVRSLDPVFVNEHYSVVVSTTGNEPEHFSTTLFEETLQTAEWQGRSINMSSFAGQVVYIGFRHHNVSNEFALALDAIALPGEILADCESVLSIDKPLKSSDLQVYPIPSRGLITLENTQQEPLNYLQIIDSQGKIVFRDQSPILPNERRNLELSDLPAGIYILHAATKNASYLTKIILQ